MILKKDSYKMKYVQCKCGLKIYPFRLNIITNTWVKDGVENYIFNCPQCDTQYQLEVDE